MTDAYNHGTVTGDVSSQNVSGLVSRGRNLSGTVQIGGKSFRELRFMPYDEFPSVGFENVLYIDTEGNGIYYYDRLYIRLTGENVIDDLLVALDKTWSSDKINSEFESDQQQIDNIGNFEALTNSEIAAILAD